MSFAEASRVERVGDGVYRANIPDGWQQGRGAFGGLVLGTIARAALAHESDPKRALRTLSADIAGPVLVGAVELRVRELRRGHNQTNLHIDVVQEENVLTSALCTLSAPRSVEVAPVAPPAPEPALKSWDDALVIPRVGTGAAVFAQHYEYRVAGPFPFSGADQGATIVYLREREREGELDTPALAALLDAPWPALFSKLRRPHAMATVSFSAQFLPSAAPISAREALYSPGRLITQHEGYCFETRELWAAGRLVAMSQQTNAVLR